MQARCPRGEEARRSKHCLWWWLERIVAGQAAPVYLEDMAGHAFRKVSLPPDLEDFVASQVASGRYASEGEVIQKGLRLLEEQETAEESLRSAVAVGLEQALRGELLDGEEVFEDLETRIDRQRDRRE